MNTTVRVLPLDAQNFMDWSELKNTNNTKAIEVQGEVANLKVTDITLSPNPGEPGQLTTGVITVLNESEKAFTSVEVIWRARRSDGSVLAEGTITIDLGAGESKQLPVSFTPDAADTYSFAAMVNPNHNNPPNEANWLKGDWPEGNC